MGEWRKGTVQEFLDLSDEEMEEIEGAIAQSGERLSGRQEVQGSSPCSSTITFRVPSRHLADMEMMWRGAVRWVLTTRGWDQLEAEMEDALHEIFDGFD